MNEPRKIAITGRRREIIEWIINHPYDCTETQLNAVCDKMAEAFCSTDTNVIQCLKGLIRRSIVLQEKHNRYSNTFTVNYFHPDLPEKFKKLAPTHVQDVMKSTEAKLRSGEYKAVDEFGAGIIKPAVVRGDPFAEDTAEKQFDGSELEETEPTTNQTSSNQFKPVHEAVEPPVAVPTVQVSRSTDGKSISISLTINLNL